MTQLICKNLTLGYNGKAVIENLSFSVNRGDYVYIIGDNGSGKSTLLKAILNLVSPENGIIKNQNIKPGYLPQHINSVRDFPASSYEIVLSGVLNGGFRPYYTKKEKALAQEIMKKLKIEDLKKRCFSELSGGQKQKVLLARALCAAKDMLLLDEPVAGLAPQAAEDMYKIIYELNQGGITVLMVSHDIDAALKYSSHILELSKPWEYYQRNEFRMKRGGGR